MDTTAKLERLLIGEDDQHWKTEHLTRELSDWENSLRVSWDDQAFRNMWTAFLYPREENASEMLEEHRQQMESAKLLCKKDEEVFVKSLEIGKRSEEIVRLMKMMEREAEACEMNLDRGNENYKHSQETDGQAETTGKKREERGSHVSALLSRRKGVF